jgi:hypothetical protein
MRHRNSGNIPPNAMQSKTIEPWPHCHLSRLVGPLALDYFYTVILVGLLWVRQTAS